MKIQNREILFNNRVKIFRKKKNRILLCVGLVIAFFTYFIITFVDYNGYECPFHKYLGVYCFLCGLTRSMWSLFNGQIYLAFCFNPLYIILLPYIVLKLFEMGKRYIQKDEFAISFDLIYLIISAFLFMVYRNTIVDFQPPEKDLLLKTIGIL